MTEQQIDLDALEALAKAATPGPWTWSPEKDQWGDCGPNLETVERGPVYQDGSQEAKETVVGSWGHDANGISVSDADKEFIAAANPSTILALIAELRQERARADERELALQTVPGYTQPKFFKQEFRKVLGDLVNAEAALSRAEETIEKALGATDMAGEWVIWDSGEAYDILTEYSEQKEAERG